MILTGAEAMVKCLELEGVKLLFGYPGAAICPFYDCLRASSIRHILTRTEQNAGHAASGYARVSGRPAVCVATSGPGATNLFTAIATAYSDSVPLVVITGQVPTYQLGRDVFQEVDTTGAAEPFTKYTYLVKDTREIPRVFKEAFYIAATGRKGPVLIDMPMDVQQQTLEFSYPQTVDIRGYKPRSKGHPGQLKRVVAALSSAKRPLLCAGGGVFSANAQSQLRTFCEQTGLPAVTTMMGLGALPTEHPLYYGMLGQSGESVANRAVQESDLLMIVGARVGDRAVGAPQELEQRTVIHIDIDSAEIGKNVGTTIPLVGDAALVLEQLCACSLHGDWSSWKQTLDVWRARQLAHRPAQSDSLDPCKVIAQLTHALNGQMLYISDVGQNQIWSARNCLLQEGRLLTTGGMGTMGYALPAAIGAKLAAPEQMVLAVCGDGAFQMSMMELATANQHGVPVKLVVMHNGCLGMVREIQSQKYDGREIGVDLSGGPDIGGIAAAYRIPFLRLAHPTQTDAVLCAFLQMEGSCILECVIDAKEDTL
ncbi:MAG: biosynthetic-type acetolactate synthase large subunit [Anaerotruncus sp.]|nr:biosynthetic-type acetolactate synthase large subunit [Anaerotruncus sp.]